MRHRLATTRQPPGRSSHSGENGSLTFDKNTRDPGEAVRRADAALRQRHGARDIRRAFKPAPLGQPPKAGYKRESPRKGVKIFRDELGVAHVNGRRRRTPRTAQVGERATTRVPPAHQDRRAWCARRPGPRSAGTRAGAARPSSRASRRKRSSRTRSTRSVASARSARRSSRWSTVRSGDQRLLPSEGHPRHPVHAERRHCVGRAHRSSVGTNGRPGGAERDVPGRARRPFPARPTHGACS